MVILAGGNRWVTVQERSSLSVNLNKFLDLLFQSSGFGPRKRRIFRHEAFAHTVLIGFHLEGDLNPVLGFYFPLFSILFPWGISIRVETCGSGRKQSVVFCGGPTYKFSMCCDRSLPFHGDIENPIITRF
jgi:hypothetical protein